jgi:hypothetical protein
VRSVNLLYDRWVLGVVGGAWDPPQKPYPQQRGTAQDMPIRSRGTRGHAKRTVGVLHSNSSCGLHCTSSTDACSCQEVGRTLIGDIGLADIEAVEACGALGTLPVPPVPSPGDSVPNPLRDRLTQPMHCWWF